eukprot:1157956-Pelagomonas_calceolata.AAC.15
MHSIENRQQVERGPLNAPYTACGGGSACAAYTASTKQQSEMVTVRMLAAMHAVGALPVQCAQNHNRGREGPPVSYTTQVH